jgi:hypothetical protein
MLYLELMVHVCNNTYWFMHDDAYDQVLVAFNIWDVTASCH